MATVNDQITAVLQDLGVIATGETPSGDDAALALDRLNTWIDGLANTPLALYTVTRTTWTIVASTTSYTIGSGGDVNVARPIGPSQIENIGYIETSADPDLELLLGRPLSEDQYAGIAQKALTSPYPTAWYYNPTYPLGTLKPWPVPTASTLLGVIYAQAPISQFAAVTDSFALPPGYTKFFRSNLALEIADAFGQQVTPRMEQRAREARSELKRANQRDRDLVIDPRALIGARHVYNINSDT